MRSDKQGRIHGNGHPVRDTVEWLIPVLWPIDLMNLPRRGPRPELKAETRLTLKLMDDLGVPMPPQAATASYYPQPSAPENPYGFSQRPPATYVPQTAPPPADNTYIPVPVVAPPPAWRAPRVLTVLMLRDGYGQFAADYWYEGGGRLRYVAMNGSSVVIPAEALDLTNTIEVNRRRGVSFNLRSAAY